MTDFRKLEYELVDYPCQDGPCLMIHERTWDHKLGALSPDHRSIGEEIIDELNMLSDELYEEQMKTPFVLAKQCKVFIEIIEEADDLIMSHLSKHYQREWKNFCKNRGVYDD